MSRFNRHCNLIGISLVNQIGIVKWKSHSNVSSMAGIPIVDIGATLKCDSNAFPMSTIAMCALGTLGLHSNSIRKWVAWGGVRFSVPPKFRRDRSLKTAQITRLPGKILPKSAKSIPYFFFEGTYCARARGILCAWFVWF